ncbi:MAG: hypothetical protein WBM08_14935 [Prochlorococcaceae cyanobacterium]
MSPVTTLDEIEAEFAGTPIEEAAVTAVAPEPAPEPSTPDGTVSIDGYVYSLNGLLDTFSESLTAIDQKIVAAVDAKVNLDSISSQVAHNNGLQRSIMSLLQSDARYSREAAEQIAEGVVSNSAFTQRFTTATKERIASELAVEANRLTYASVNTIKEQIRTEIEDDLRQRAAEADVVLRSIKGLLTSVFRDEISELRNEIQRSLIQETEEQLNAASSRLAISTAQMNIIERRFNALPAEVRAETDAVNRAPWERPAFAPDVHTEDMERNLLSVTRTLRVTFSMTASNRRPSSACRYGTPGIWKIGDLKPEDRADWDQIYIAMGEGDLPPVPLWQALAINPTTDNYNYIYGGKPSARAALCHVLAMHPNASSNHNGQHGLLRSFWAMRYTEAGFDIDMTHITNLDGERIEITNELRTELGLRRSASQTMGHHMKTLWLHANPLEMRIRHGLIEG